MIYFSDLSCSTCVLRRHSRTSDMAAAPMPCESFFSGSKGQRTHFWPCSQTSFLANFLIVTNIETWRFFTLLSKLKRFTGVPTAGDWSRYWYQHLKNCYTDPEFTSKNSKDKWFVCISVRCGVQIMKLLESTNEEKNDVRCGLMRAVRLVGLRWEDGGKDEWVRRWRGGWIRIGEEESEGEGEWQENSEIHRLGSCWPGGIAIDKNLAITILLLILLIDPILFKVREEKSTHGFVHINWIILN